MRRVVTIGQCGHQLQRTVLAFGRCVNAFRRRSAAGCQTLASGREWRENFTLFLPYNVPFIRIFIAVLLMSAQGNRRNENKQFMPAFRRFLVQVMSRDKGC